MDINEVLGIDESDLHMRSAIDMEEQRSSLVRKLTAIRDDNSLTQKAVADLLHISKQAVTQFESDNRDIKLSTLIRYAMAVGAHIDIRVEPVQRFYRAQIKKGSLYHPQEACTLATEVKGLLSYSEFDWSEASFDWSEASSAFRSFSSDGERRFQGEVKISA